MSTLTARDGSIINYSDNGNGAPLLFIHGWMMSQKIWHYQQPLSREMRVISIDLRGHGSSDSTGFSYEACLSDVTELLDHLGIESVIIVGWSMGSQLAILATNLLRERASGLILVSGTAKFCNSDDYSCGLPPNEARGMAARLKRGYKETSGNFFKSMFSADEITKADLRRIAATTLSELPPIEISLEALKELNNTDIRALLPGINIPVLLIHGDKDIICPPESSVFMGDSLPLSTVRMISSSGHAPFLTDPERFNTEVATFVRSVNGND